MISSPSNLESGKLCKHICAANFALGRKPLFNELDQSKSFYSNAKEAETYPQARKYKLATKLSTYPTIEKTYYDAEKKFIESQYQQNVELFHSKKEGVLQKLDSEMDRLKILEYYKELDFLLENFVLMQRKVEKRNRIPDQQKRRNIA